jgi:pimeloyl-ACP methyl ester carboxylesterase
MQAHAAAIVFAVGACLLGLASGATESTPDVGRMYAVGNSKLYTSIRGAGRPLVFLHGGFSYFDATFAQQANYFAAFRTVIGIDQRGHGHSPDNDEPFSYRQMADDTAALIEKLHVGVVDIIGHSDGGNVGLLIARYHPNVLRRLVVSGANARGDYNGSWAYLHDILRPVDKFAATVPAMVRDNYVRVSPDGVQHWPIIVAKTKALWETRIVLDPQDLRSIQTPVLVLAGDHDLVSLEHTIEIFHQLSNAQLCILPASGHGTMSDDPEDFNRVTRTFLERP